MLKTTETMSLTAENLVMIDPKIEHYQTLIDSAIASTQVTAPTANVLVVFDSRVQDLGLLYDALVPGAVGYTIDAQDDALTVITRLLTQTGARRLALVAHGEPGVVQIGATPLNREQLQAKAQLLQEWGVEEIALYSCEVGKDVGFVAELKRLTGATVTAATGKVGSAAQGGNWNIGWEAVSPIFNLEAVAAYQHTLAITVNSISGINLANSDTSFNAAESQTVNFNLSLDGIVAGTNTTGANEDILIGVYSSSGNLLYWQILNNQKVSSTTQTYDVSFNLDTAVGTYQGGLYFKFWQGTFTGTNQSSLTGSSSLPTGTFNVNNTATNPTASNASKTSSTASLNGNGNLSPKAGETFNLDTIAPNATTTITSLSTDSGTAGDFITNTASQTVRGGYNGLLSGESIQVSLDGTNWVGTTLN
ncbi:MAG: DUF4347 domain-containing protein, partial [Coleofasciculus sp. C3-bin4]|nr:DUF4347 domain-containing protein [Coleofasciculus sp. C3-bin4]